MAAPPDAMGDPVEQSALIHREILQLAFLIAVAVAAFLLTRAVAANNRDMTVRDAAEWYGRGQRASQEGRVDDAIDALRRATVRDRADRRYALALAHALALKGDAEAARSALLTLRESAPEDADINLQLARLAAGRHDVPEALRFYHNALYAPWPSDQSEARRAVRLELIRFLLGDGQGGRALAELLALTADLPDDSSLRIDAAQLFARAGDYGHSLEQFQRVLRTSPGNSEAIAGAGQAAFHLGDYVLAGRYLHAAPIQNADLRNTRDVADLVLSSDPLATRIGSAERRRRLVAAFSYAKDRLTVCLARSVSGTASPEQLALAHDVEAFDDELTPRAILEQDTVEAGIELIDRVERDVAQRCGPLTALDQALALIGHRHGADAR